MFLVGIIVIEGYNDNYSNPKIPDPSKYYISRERNKNVSQNQTDGELHGANNYKKIKREIKPDLNGFYSKFLRKYDIVDDSLLFESPISEGQNHFDDKWYQYYMRMIPHKALSNTASNLKDIYEQEKILDSEKIDPFMNMVVQNIWVVKLFIKMT